MKSGRKVVEKWIKSGGKTFRHFFSNFQSSQNNIHVFVHKGIVAFGGEGEEKWLIVVVVVKMKGDF